MTISGDRADKLERQLAAAQDLSRVGSWEWDRATGLSTWSPELFRMFGMDPSERPLRFDEYLERVDPAERASVNTSFHAAIRPGGRFAHRVRISRPDGTVADFENVGEAVTVNGEVTGMVGACRDVTGQRVQAARLQLFADIVDNVQIALSVWRDDTPGDASGLRLVTYNAAAQRALGPALAAGAGQTLSALFPSILTTGLPALMLDVTLANSMRELAACRFLDLPGTPMFAAKVFPLPDRCVGLALEDTTEIERAYELRRAERHALEMLAAGAPLADILAVLAVVTETLAPGLLASVHVLDETGRYLMHAAAPSLPKGFSNALDGVLIGPAVGSCGTAAFRRAPVTVTDIETDPLWLDWRDLALAHGLRACWSTPILAPDKHVLGTFALYDRVARAPDAAVLARIARATHVAAIAIERRQLDDQLRALPSRIESVREEERTSIAREVHDELGQALTALMLDIAWIGRRIDGDSQIGQKLHAMARNADEVLGVVRRISAALRPGLLDDVGLQAAIEWQAEEFARRAGIPCDVAAALGDLQLDRSLATAVFRIFQEALTNVTRHAQATRVQVSLGLERGQLRLEVADDGVGMPAVAPRTGSLGLLGMRERARRLGGDCTVKRRVPRGTTVALTLPLRFPREPVAK